MRLIDIYCERIGPSFWAEPLNALSNLAFLVVAFLAWKLYKEDAETKNDVHFTILVILLVTIGIGSFLFHTYATLLSLAGDILPIMLFAFYYSAIAMKRVLKWSGWQTTIGMVVFIVFFYFFGDLFPRDALNHSVVYIPFGIALLTFSLLSRLKGEKAAKQYFIAFGFFSAAMFFRIIDMGACSIVPFGTHFLWHIITAYMLFVLLKVLLFYQLAISQHSKIT